VTLALLLLAALLGGGVNALAGGGTFIVFPSLLLAGVSSVKANATASLVFAPGSLVSTWVYRSTLTGQSRARIAWLLIVSLAGSAAGSVLLLNTSNKTFSSLVPWLLLIAALFFMFAPRLRAAAARSTGNAPGAVLFAGQFVIAIYGGYFGAGMGVLMIALFLVASDMGVQASNGVRLLCGTGINILAIALFAWRGALDWKAGIPMLLAGIAGGYYGARIVRRLNEETARKSILIYAWALTAYFFVRLAL
jgi:hypothetical protein